jgi:flagellar assembly protein FliH
MPTSPQDDASHTQIRDEEKSDPRQQDGNPLQEDRKPDTRDETEADVTQEAQGSGDENGR